GGRWRRIVDGWIRIDGRSIYDGWVITRHIHDLSAGRLDHDDLFVLDGLSLDLLLFTGLESAILLSLGTHALHRIHHIALLREEGIAKVGGPFDVSRKPFDH